MMSIQSLRGAVIYDVERDRVVVATLAICEVAPGLIEEIDVATWRPWTGTLTRAELADVVGRLEHARLMREDDLARGQAVLVDEVRDAVEATPTVAWAGEMAA